MKKTTGLSAGLFFGIFMSLFYVGLSLVTEHTYTNENILRAIYFGLAAGALAGFLFGCSLWILKIQKWSKTQPGENVLFETPANHFMGAEAVGGKLYFTDRRIVFKSHRCNFQNHELSIDLENIKGFERYKPLGFNSPQGLLLIK